MIIFADNKNQVYENNNLTFVDANDDRTGGISDSASGW